MSLPSSASLITKLPITHYAFVYIIRPLCLVRIIQGAVMHFIISFIMPFYASFIEFLPLRLGITFVATTSSSLFIVRS